MPLLGLLFASQLLVTVADQPPTFDVKPSCEADISDDVETAKSCQEDEQAAREQLAKMWNGFSAPDRAMCTDLTEGYNPSYVELLSCLQIMRDADGVDRNSPVDK
jgi:hypothetical protein